MKHKITDSHIHLDFVIHSRPEAIRWMKENKYAAVSWAYSERADSVIKLREYLKNKAEFIHEQSASGLRCWYLAGIHPRCIPGDLKPEDVASVLSPCMEDPLCRGIGEIGLETSDSREQEIFLAQLEFSRRVTETGKVVGIHTPRSNKGSVTRIILEILKNYKEIASSIVVDHCNEEIIGAVLDSGFRAGVTLSPSKSTIWDLKRIIQMYPQGIERIMCNTDSALELYDDLFLAGSSSDLPDEISGKIFDNNAVSFFKLS